MSVRRPLVDNYNSYREFKEQVEKYVREREENTSYYSESHMEEENKVVRECPHCGAPSILSIVSDPGDPSWRCVGKTRHGNRHKFCLDNVPG